MLQNDLAVRHCREYLLSLEISGNKAYLENIQVFSKEQWLVSLWDNSFAKSQVLRPVQLLALAQPLVEDSGLLPVGVLNSQRIVRRFVQAFELAHAYQLDTAQLSGPLSSLETEAFCQWQHALQQRLDDLSALSSAQLPQALVGAMEQLELPEQIVCSPQLEWTPAEQAFIQATTAAASQPCEWLEWQAASPQAGFDVHRADTSEQELQAAAAWLAQQVADKPAAQIGLVLANYSDENVAALEQALQQHFYPQALVPGLLAADELLATPWQTPRAGRLLDHPMITVAVDLLRLATSSFEANRLSRVILSGYTDLSDASAVEHEFTADFHRDADTAMAQWDLLLRDRLPAEFGLAEALAIAPIESAADEARFAGLRRLHEQVRSLPQRQAPSAWVRDFDHLLASLNWPNIDLSVSPENLAAADRADYTAQCLRGLSQTMDVFRGLDRPLGDINLSTALHWLELILREKRFQLRRRQAAAIQIISLADAREQLFDQLWILGLNEHALPQPPEVSAFIPRDILRRLKVPRVDADDCLRRDTALLNSVIESCPVVVCSYAQHSADGVALSPCALLAWPPQALAGAAAGSQALQFKAGFSRAEADAVPAITAEERASLRGGTSLFRHMAVSPFIAFCRHRLRLRDFPQRVEGLDPATQGQWLHRVLELLWQQLGGSEALAGINDEQLRSRVDRLCLSTVQGEAYAPVLLNVERRRIAGLIMQWLAYERQRPEPFTVHATEQRENIDVAGLSLNVQVDRIDRIDGRHVVIDYKSGRIQAKKLNASELLEPQLPIYAVYTALGRQGGVDGVSLAQLHSDGISEHTRSNWVSGLVPAARKPRNAVDTPEAWEGERLAWERQISALSAAFQAGDIRHQFDASADGLRFDEDVLALAREANT